MGLEDAVDKRSEVRTTKGSKDRLREARLCPACGIEGEETDKWYWRCINVECNVITYIHSDEREKIVEMLREEDHTR